MKIEWVATHSVPVETLERNAAHAKTLGHPMLGAARAPYLAVVGGGPSVADHVEELSLSPVIWAINGAYQWLRGQGILSQFYTIDPAPGIAELCKHADSAVMATWCAPEAFAAMPGAYVELVDLEGGCGPTSASSVPIIAARCGFRRVSFYGCEGSFGETTHAYENRTVGLLKVRCNGQEFLTSPQMVQQTEYLAEFIRAAPDVFIDRSGGLLSACIADPEIDVIAASRSIYNAVMEAA